MNCGKLDKVLILGLYVSLKLRDLGWERPEVFFMEHSLVDDRIPQRYLKSHHALKQEAIFYKME
jgi:hypothetical protein